MKKIKTSYILIMLLTIGLSSAALVTYLSNSIDVTLNVVSPFSLWFNDDSNSLTVDTTGGSSFNYTTHLQNNANNNIDIYKTITTITSTANWKGNEFDSFILNGVEVKNLLCHVKTNGDVIKFSDIGSENTNTARLIYDENGDCVITKYTHPTNVIIDENITITLNSTILPGTYNMELCHLYSLDGSCA